MGAIPNYYRPVGEFYPRTANILTEAGVFPLELETYLGQAGADSIKLLNRQNDLKDIYAPFVRYQKDLEFVDYTKPRVNAYYETFVVPASIGKKTLKSGKKANPLAPFISWIGGMVIFASLYVLVRDCKIILNSVKIIQKTKNYRKFITEEKNKNHEVLEDPVYHSLNKVLRLREKIYKRNLISAIVSVAMTVSIVALAVIAIGSAIAASYALLLGAAAGLGALLLGHCIKTIVEWKGRMDKKDANEILKCTEALRIVLPYHLEQEFQREAEFENKPNLAGYYAHIINERPLYVPPVHVYA